jgi:hypothetical protein
MTVIKNTGRYGEYKTGFPSYNAIGDDHIIDCNFDKRHYKN